MSCFELTFRFKRVNINCIRLPEPMKQRGIRNIFKFRLKLFDIFN
jgi:hypothetical protein